MSFFFEDRPADSPYIEGVAHIQFDHDDAPLCAADGRWEIIVKKHNGKSTLLLAGPMTRAALAPHFAGSEFIVAKFKLGIYMPRLPAKQLLDAETPMPEASCDSFWLDSSTWQLPTYENFDLFVNKLMRSEVLVRDPVVHAALHDDVLTMPSRTIQHRFKRVTGLTQTYIRQIERARQAADMLEHGTSILDTVYALGYFDQPHLTRSLKRFIGQTPAQIVRQRATP